MKFILLKHKYYNLPNFLTFLRLIFSIICAAYLINNKLTEVIILLALIALTELDGTIARKFKLTSKFGKIFDPIIDVSSFAIIGVALIFFKKLFNFYYILILFLCVIIQVLNIGFIYLKSKNHKKIHKITKIIFLIPLSLFFSVLLNWKVLENFLIISSFLFLIPLIIFEYYLLNKVGE